MGDTTLKLLVKGDPTAVTIRLLDIRHQIACWGAESPSNCASHSCMSKDCSSALDKALMGDTMLKLLVKGGNSSNH